MTASHTPSSAAALVERGLAVAGLPLDSMLLTGSLHPGEPAGLGIIGRPKYTQAQAFALAAALGDESPRSSAPSNPEAVLYCTVPGATVEIHFVAEVAA